MLFFFFDSHDSRTVPPLCIPSSSIVLSSVLQQHATSVLSPDTSDRQRLNIRRTDLIPDAIAQFERPSFDVSKPIRVRFIGEPAVDTGGPRREFFRLFLQDLKSKSSLFQHTSEGLIPLHNGKALRSGAYKMISKILAACILHGGPPPQCFAPIIADFIIHGKENSSPSIGCIPDADVQCKLNQVNNDYCMKLLCVYVCMYVCII